ncbi:acyl carrier protein 1, chloroplastic-like [Mercurialis annua]|uniref:acyl carrier protein 1, chloroplastic-like n=1 Tax=Mercurialis annua TaxID=3986 RepID=UPI002160040C|nr:acyl carrier protein 1, chloroplastic-like [Mercurialis annua]
MAAAAGSSVSMHSRSTLAAAKFSSLKSFALPNQRTSMSFRVQPVPARLRISCAAKPATVDKVCSIVKKQLALSTDTAVTGESKFAALGADSLDTVEIVMGLEEEFGISVDEEKAQTIATVQDAADLIEEIIEKKGA